MSFRLRSHISTLRSFVLNTAEKASASEAYYAMYHATRAWALQKEGEAPGTHRGMGLFIHRLVEDNRLDASLRDHFLDAKASRERWHYEGLGPLPTFEGSEVIEAAEVLVEEALARRRSDS